MALLGDPDYSQVSRVNDSKVSKMSDDQLLLNYLSLDVRFKFPLDTKYPNIPTRVDENADVYPLEGRSTITGSEYLVAKYMGCNLQVVSGVLIPFKTSEEEKRSDLSYVAPFRGIISDLQKQRRLHPKKSFYNLMYKQIGNSIYGLTSMGLSGNKRFDVKSRTFVRLEGGCLANPVIASYITGFTRAVVGECLNNVWKLGGRVVSVTTDGFLTDLEDVEHKITTSGLEGTQCIVLYKRARKLLSDDDSSLEVKNIEREGLLS